MTQMNSDAVRWTTEPRAAFTTHTAVYGRWTLRVTEFPSQPANAPKGNRYQAQVFSTRGTMVNLRPTWCTSLDVAKQLCITFAPNT